MKWEDYPAFIRCSYIFTTLVETHPIIVILDHKPTLDQSGKFYHPDQFLQGLGLKTKLDVHQGQSDCRNLHEFDYNDCKIIFRIISGYQLGIADGNQKTLVFFREQDRSQAMLLKLSS